jgi:hypothetical protein
VVRWDGGSEDFASQDSALDDTTLEDDGILDSADSLETDDLSADALDTGIDAGEGYRGSTRYGTTLAEEERRESLDTLLAEEEPEPSSDEAWTDEEQPEDVGGSPQPRSGRLLFADAALFPGEDLAGSGNPDLVALDVGVDGGGASAEEAAVHLTEAPPFREPARPHQT